MFFVFPKNSKPTPKLKLSQKNPCRYDACVAPGGAALFLSGVDDASIHRCHFENTAAFESIGGSIFLRDESDLTVTDCTAYDSRADFAGGGK